MLTKEQTDAIKKLYESPKPEVSLAGPAGSGKTTLIKELMGCWPNADDTALPTVEVVTPTNKAAQVLNSKGIPAHTLYAVFFQPEEVVTYGPRGNIVSRWLKFTPCNEYSGKLGEGKRRFAPVITVDESSMVQGWVIDKLRKMCDKLILVGDPHQLPPVNDKRYPGGYFNELNHDAKLVTIHRQAEGSGILSLATDIRTESPKVISHINAFRPEVGFEDAVAAGYQFIAFTNKERSRINHITRVVLGRRCILPEVGDYMISIDNNTEKLLNGTTFICRGFWWDDETKHLARMRIEHIDGSIEDRPINMIRFLKDQLVSQTAGYGPREPGENEPAGDAVTYAYCMTAHKAQGSEYDKVAVVDQRKVIHMMTEAALARGEKSLSGHEMSRRWLYTAVTRARTELVVAGQWWAVLTTDEEMAA